MLWSKRDLIELFDVHIHQSENWQHKTKLSYNLPVYPPTLGLPGPLAAEGLPTQHIWNAIAYLGKVSVVRATLHSHMSVHLYNCLSISHPSTAWNRHPSSFIIQPSTFIILHSSFLHFATFKLFSSFACK